MQELAGCVERERGGQPAHVRERGQPAQVAAVPFVKLAAKGVMATAEVPVLQTVSSQDLARELHSEQGPVFLLDCRSVLSYNACHISGAANVNMGNLLKKRFMAGKIGLVDLLSFGREQGSAAAWSHREGGGL